MPLQHWMRAENIFSNPIVPEETVEVKPIHLPIYPDNFDPRENQSWTEEEFNQVDIAQITLIREFFKDKHFLYLDTV